MRKKKVKIFVDMDGVLAEQSHDLHLHMYKKDFFKTLPEVDTMLELTKMLIKSNKYDVFTLSSVIDSPYCEPEKNLWLDKHLPEMKQENRLFVPYGINKALFVRSKLNTENSINILIDDFTYNLMGWKLENGLGIKVLNNLNNTKGSWVKSGGFAIKAYDEPLYNLSLIDTLIYEKLLEFKMSRKGVV